MTMSSPTLSWMVELLEMDGPGVGVQVQAKQARHCGHSGMGSKCAGSEHGDAAHGGNRSGGICFWCWDPCHLLASLPCTVLSPHCP